MHFQSSYSLKMHFQVSVFRFSAWKFNEERGQFYYHAFTPEQPDLNYRNPLVVEEMKVKPVMEFEYTANVKS